MALSESPLFVNRDQVVVWLYISSVHTSCFGLPLRTQIRPAIISQRFVQRQWIEGPTVFVTYVFVLFAWQLTFLVYNIKDVKKKKIIKIYIKSKRVAAGRFRSLSIIIIIIIGRRRRVKIRPWCQKATGPRGVLITNRHRHRPHFHHNECCTIPDAAVCSYRIIRWSNNDIIL